MIGDPIVTGVETYRGASWHDSRPVAVVEFRLFCTQQGNCYRSLGVRFARRCL